jgi:hypothetical protein
MSFNYESDHWTRLDVEDAGRDQIGVDDRIEPAAGDVPRAVERAGSGGSG